MTSIDLICPQPVQLVTASQRFRMDCETPVSLFLKLALDEPYSFVLESVDHGQHSGRFSFVGWDPLFRFSYKPNCLSLEGLFEGVFESDNPLQVLKELLSKIQLVDEQSIPNARGGLVGNISWESVRLVEKIGELQADEGNWIDLMLARHVLVFDHLSHVVTVLVHEIVDTDRPAARMRADRRLKKVLDRIRLFSVNNDTIALPEPEIDLSQWESNLTQEEFCERVLKAKHYIVEGDIFQVVLSRAIRRPFDGDPFEVYRVLRQVNPSPYMYYLRQGERTIVGGSPEALVHLDHGMLETHPIAGTRPRGKTLEEDMALERELMADAKELSEHLMLVDLGRNDLGRVAEPGSVTVPIFQRVERFSHVMHIVSVVKARLRKDLHALDALMSVFPAGTLSGAPKIRAMQIINELEPESRGIYGGAIGFIDFSGNMDSCIAIRTATIEKGVIRIQAGAGVVADSNPLSEYQETTHKMMSMITAVEKALQENKTEGRP